MRVKEIGKIVLFIGIGIIKKGRGISQGKQIHLRPSQMNGIQITKIQNLKSRPKIENPRETGHLINYLSSFYAKRRLRSKCLEHLPRPFLKERG